MSTEQKAAMNAQKIVKNTIKSQKNNFLKIGKWLHKIKTRKLYNHMQPYFPTYGLYLASEGISAKTAKDAINCWFRCEEIKKYKNGPVVVETMKRMYISNLVLACQLPPGKIIKMASTLLDKTNKDWQKILGKPTTYRGLYLTRDEAFTLYYNRKTIDDAALRAKLKDFYMSFKN